MLYFDYEVIEGEVVLNACAADADNKDYRVVVYDVTHQPGGHADSPLIGENSYADTVGLKEGHDYYVRTVPPGGRGTEYSATISVRNGEVIVIQEDDFAVAVEIIGQLQKKDFRNFNVMRLSRWDMERAINIVIDNSDD